MQQRFRHREIGLFGGELYRLRVARGFSQEEVASRANITRGYYGELENSRKGPPPRRTLKRIVAALELDQNTLQNLEAIADAERCGLGRSTGEVPRPISAIIEQLMLGANRISEEKIRRISLILEE